MRFAKKLLLLGLFLCLPLVVFSFLGFENKNEEYGRKMLIGDKKLRVDIARTPAEHSQGLSDKKSLCSDCGLLFIFDSSGIYPFWMRRMYFDIDILWIVGDKVVDITFGAKAPAKDEFDAPKERYSSKVPIDKVLEVNAGWVEKNGIKIGDEVELK